ncbi:hypothetical protein Tco_0865600 [Tanacetum coccineum]
MIRPITNKEIKMAMFSIGDNKAPGLDGFFSCFFKHVWDISREDVCSVIRDFYMNGQLHAIIRSINALVRFLLISIRKGWLMCEKFKKSRAFGFTIDFGKHFVPQQKLSDEQAFRLQTSHPNTDQSASSPVKIEAPRELPKSMENEDLKGQIQENVFVTTALQDELKRLKGNDVLDNATTITNATTIAPGIFKLDFDPLAPRLKSSTGASRSSYRDDK